MPSGSEVAPILHSERRPLHSGEGIIAALVVHESQQDFEAGQFDASRAVDPPRDGIELLQRHTRGSYTSAAVGVDEGFLSVVLTVNFTRSSPKSFGVLGLVSARTAHGWSPWFRMLRWGAPELATGEIEANSGRVDVDLLKLADSAHGVRYSVAWQAADSSCRLRRVALSLAGVRTSVPTPAPDISETRLRVPFLSQWDTSEHPAARVCSPTCLAMVARYYDVDLSTDQLATLAFDSHHGLYGNWSANMLAMSFHGFRAVVERADALDVLDQAVIKGQPVITSIAYRERELSGAPMNCTNGHLVVVAGLTDRGDYLVRDPAARGRDDWREYVRSEFERAWLGHGGVCYRIQPEELP